MLINEVAKLCDLTKKAVEYYTEQELVNPNILENGYRDFSEHDIEILKHIALYRKLGLNISEIKQILLNPSILKTIVYNKRIDLERERLKQDILKKLCDGQCLETLENEINSINSQSIIIKRLMDLFPSYYGKFISLNFSSFLTEKIETQEQMEAFNEIIDFFDNVPDIELPSDLQEYLDGYLEKYSSEDEIEKMNNIIQTKNKSIKNVDEFVRNNKEIIEQYNEYKKTKEYKNSPAYRLMELMKQVCTTNGYYDKFIPAMRKLSPLYNEYYEQISQEQLAEKIGVARQTISNWELEESYPDVNQLLKLAKIFKVSLDDLANYSVENKDNGVINNEITIVSKIENVIVHCNKVQSSQQYKGGKSAPKYALFSVNDNSQIFPNNTFLGWYENKEKISKEIEEIAKAISSKHSIYELKYNVEVDKKFLGMSLKLKK